MTMDRRELAGLLLDAGVVEISLRKPFTYASGILSPIYVDCRLIASFPSLRQKVAAALLERVRELRLEADSIVAAGPSAVAFATQLAKKLEIPLGYTRLAAKTHGTRRRLEGDIPRNSKCLLLADIISTEANIHACVEAVRTLGITPICCLSVFSNSLGVVERYLEREGVSYDSLTDLGSLMAVAEDRGTFSRPETETVREWMSRPDDWGKARVQLVGPQVMATNREVAEVLLSAGCVKFSPGKPFEFSSGVRSPIYVDNRLLMSHPDDWHSVMDCLLGVVIEEIGIQSIDCIAGAATAGIPHATYLADEIGLPLVYVKTVAAAHGRRSKIEGRVDRGDRVLLVEDVISSGRSAVLDARILRDAGALVDSCVALFTYGLPDASRHFREENLDLLALTDLEALLRVGEATGQVDAEDSKLIGAWRENLPAGSGCQV